MSEQKIAISNHFCDWDEMMDACERHGLRPTINSLGNYSQYVCFQMGNTEITWFLKWSLDKDWESYWTERDELS